MPIVLQPIAPHKEDTNCNYEDWLLLNTVGNEFLTHISVYDGILKDILACVEAGIGQQMELYGCLQLLNWNGGLAPVKWTAI